MIQNIEKLKTKLVEEKTALEASLVDVGQKNPSNKEDWEGKPEQIDAERSDKIDTADNIEEYETNSAITAELEIRLKNIDAALARIENDTYGICKVCGEKIEDDRLEANPAATTCKAHIND